ncbi:sigma-70 family RNA polymerase sigma factor [Gelidibacter japonicus]|uniref:sigma-70 family RNA polymerase sigma factor n=1 Tax=Gelidibacter japonicus TaxID=1962232 RepID=UPI003A938078
MRTKNDHFIPASNKLEPHLWVNQYADYLFAYACLRVEDKELAKDLVQETFLGALERLEKFKGLCSEKTWLTAILKNKIFDVYRKRSSGLNGQSLSIANGLEIGEFFDGETGHWNKQHYPASFAIEQPDTLQNKEFHSLLQSCMKKFPPLWVSAFTMKHIDGESTETICSELNLTPSNFWVIMHRSKVQLRSYLQKNWI